MSATSTDLLRTCFDEFRALRPSGLDCRDELYDPAGYCLGDRPVPLRIWLAAYLAQTAIITVNVVILIVGLWGTYSLPTLIFIGLFSQCMLHWLIGAVNFRLTPAILWVISRETFYECDVEIYGFTPNQMLFCKNLPYYLFALWADGDDIEHDDVGAMVRRMASLFALFVIVRVLCSVQLP